MLMFGRKQQNSVKQLSINKKINKYKRILEWLQFPPPEDLPDAGIKQTTLMYP